MDPGNPEYSAALNQAMNQGSGVYGGYRPNANMNAGGCNSCDVCSSLICADCCCECMGGDLIFLLLRRGSAGKGVRGL